MPQTLHYFDELIQLIEINRHMSIGLIIDYPLAEYLEN